MHTEKLSGAARVPLQSRARSWLPLVPGLLVITLVGTLSWILGQYFPKLGGVTIAIVLGVLAGNALPNLTRLEPGVTVAEKNILPVAIALLGVELQLQTLIALGPMTIVIILASIATALLVSMYLGRALGYSTTFSLLMGAGNGICGSSAVAATSAALRADGKDIGISISVVNLLGTFGIFVLPAMVHLFRLGDIQSGLLIGGTLQAVGQVVAAGFALSDPIGGIATAVKMGRVLMLGPVVVLIGSVMNRRINPGGAKAPIKIPAFIVGFFVLSVLSSLHVLPVLVNEALQTSGKFLLILAMAGIGMRIQLQALYRSGPTALLFGLAVWGAQIGVTLGLILLTIR